MLPSPVVSEPFVDETTITGLATVTEPETKLYCEPTASAKTQLEMHDNNCRLIRGDLVSSPLFTRNLTQGRVEQGRAMVMACWAICRSQKLNTLQMDEKLQTNCQGLHQRVSQCLTHAVTLR